VPRLVLGHGASGDAASMRPYVDGLSERGLEALVVDLRRGRSVPPAEQSIATFSAQVRAGDAAGGHSYGGRVASLMAAERPDDVRGLVLFSYPLHPPGRPERWEDRTAHWESIRCPVLLFIGDADPFAKPELLDEAVGRLAHGELVLVPGGGHGLHRSARFGELLDRTAEFLRSLD
jgi:predicted alpha/beta-hydrolase family hydrolase